LISRRALAFGFETGSSVRWYDPSGREMSIQPATSGSHFAVPEGAFGVSVPAVRRFTVDEYHRMIEAGILGENDRVELIDGWIVEMSPIGPPQATSVSLLAALLQERVLAGWIVRVQSPITITIASSEPKPDIVVARGRIRDYVDHHPSGSEIALVVEVADATLQFDRQQKRKQYAVAGIPEYWIVNLIDRCVEIYKGPARHDYPAPVVVDSTGTFELMIGGKNVRQISVADLLP
jgi:Uma2 family endonuclease